MAETMLTVEIVTPRTTAYSATAQSITLPGTMGPFQVLINHAPIISSLELGLIRIVDHEGYEVLFATNGGFAEVKNNAVSIVVESAEPATDINLDHARSELSRLEALAAQGGSGSDEHKRVIDQAKNRVRAAEALLQA